MPCHFQTVLDAGGTCSSKLTDMSKDRLVDTAGAGCAGSDTLPRVSVVCRSQLQGVAFQFIEFALVCFKQNIIGGNRITIFIFQRLAISVCC